MEQYKVEITKEALQDIIRVSERHPKACRWIIIVAFISITIYQFIEQGWNSSFGLICIGVILATNSMFKDNSK